jgi:hypothetical protein
MLLSSCSASGVAPRQLGRRAPAAARRQRINPTRSTQLHAGDVVAGAAAATSVCSRALIDPSTHEH